jgi:hypothetical protein
MKVNRTTLLGVALAIFAGALWLYWPSVHGGFLAGMDDDEYLRQAIRLKGLTWDAVQWAFTSTQPYYHPLPRLSHLIDYQIWGTNAKGHHVTGVVLHALNTALVFGFLWTLLGVAGASSTTHERLALAIGVAVVFAIHPLQVETVAWMSGRTQLLCTAFGVGSLWAYVAGARRWIVWALFIAALLSKPMAVSLPFAMLALDYFLVGQHEKPDYGELLRRNATLMVVGVAAAAATIITESRGGGLLVPLEEVCLSQRILLTLQSLMFYPWKLVWPPRAGAVGGLGSVRDFYSAGLGADADGWTGGGGPVRLHRYAAVATVGGRSGGLAVASKRGGHSGLSCLFADVRTRFLRITHATPDCYLARRRDVVAIRGCAIPEFGRGELGAGEDVVKQGPGRRSTGLRTRRRHQGTREVFRTREPGECLATGQPVAGGD